MSSEDIDLSHLRGYERKKILDIGSGSGIIARRIRDELGCDVFAIEPGLEESNGVERDPFISSCNELGQDKVEKCTLQDAIKNTKYQQAFEIVTVHKYNVNFEEKHEFVSALSKVVKPYGHVLIHTVEHERIMENNELYLLDDLKLYFADVSYRTRSYQNGRDAIIFCYGPRNW
ncbi:methyltransferase domain-containing protein [Endozoicomonas sp. SCSIO W0465]|uniref:methyltransferase domain-containing protein n=1 Tax=Endozoicomonas sp. SCSIO W0465 TaxID=2918516 RepID=UPI00207583A6|nr:methyltransferase domain-containing protein [Endozoicomonas sp. SCSIO W0465]USE35840.1 class I SAM-dependent methyltransferase [Endozoicomonas sp. SCSIO W0465]